MNLYEKSLKRFNDRFFAYATMALLGQSCLGSAAAMYILSNGTNLLQMLQLTIVVLICMSVNTSIFGQLSPRIVFNLLITSVLSSTFFILLNTLILL